MAKPVWNRRLEVIMRVTGEAARLEGVGSLGRNKTPDGRRPSVAKGVAGTGNRFVQVLDEATKKKGDVKPLKRPSLAEEFFRENPMPWLLDADPVEGDRQSA